MTDFPAGVRSLHGSLRSTYPFSLEIAEFSTDDV